MPYQLKPQRSATLIAALLVLLAVVGGITASRAFAYTGPFCNGVYLYQGNTCTSNTVGNIRRAVGHGAGYTFIEINTNVGNRTAQCRSNGCNIGTQYLPRDGTGTGLIENIGGLRLTS